MALNIATIKSLPLQLGSFFNDLKSKIASSSSSGSGSSSSNSLSAGYRQLFLQIIAFILFAALSFWVINQVRVNGPIFNTLKQYQDLVADTLPPAMYPVDAFASYNEAYVASTNFNNEKRDKALANAAKDEAEFKARSEYWRKSLNNEKLQGSLEAVITAGENFFQVANKRYIPALPLGTVAASAPLSDLTAAFEVTKQTGSAFTLEISKENNDLVSSQTSFIKLVLLGLLLLGLVLILLMFFFGKKQTVQSVNLTNQLAQEGQDNQEAVLQLLDEMGDLADGDLTVKA
ncbi:MAG: methyl-accepting chemotaxis protein, partial [Bacteroidia bacterium]|nr:methyl-accepting chemotaxis protein [Methylotenera sp.]